MLHYHQKSDMEVASASLSSSSPPPSSSSSVFAAANILFFFLVKVRKIYWGKVKLYNQPASKTCTQDEHAHYEWKEAEEKPRGNRDQSKERTTDRQPETT